jgi:hypothetical protein
LERASEPWYVATIQQRYGRLSDAPLAAREEVIRIVGRRAAEYTEQFFKEARRLNALDDIVVRAKQVPAGAISSKAAAVRELLAGADVLSQHIDVLLASGRVDDAEQARKQLELVRRWLGARPPPPATPSPSRYVPTVVPAFEGNLARARASLASAEQILRTVPADAPSFSGAVGRSVIDGSALKASSVNWHATIDRTQKRNDWAGLLDDQKRPFEFKTHVDNFRTFRGVGGGIHFGNDASPSSEQTFAQSVLSYDVNRGALELSMPDGAVYVYVAPPDVTRSLYQFAAARRNAAISIGWSGTSHVRDRDQRSQSILLDPYFVDTRVGRDLILADTIPWTLDQATLPNGTINPIAGTFKRELAAYHAAQLAQTNTLLANIEPFRESDRSTWASQMSSTFLGIIVKTLLESDSKTAALATLTELSTRLNDEQQKTFSGLLTELTPSLSENTSKASREVASLAVVLSSRSGSTQDVALFRLWSAFELADETKGNRVTLDLARRRVAERAVAAVPVTSLAVLMDQPTQIVLQRGNRGVHGLGLVGSMKYRYATSRLEDGDAGVLRSARDAQGNVEAVEIQGLTAAANSGLAALEEAYRPLRAVAEYARIKAFLAWATANVGRVDLSALASVQPQSPAFRTPDALRR